MPRSAARYGIILDASLITGIDPPHQIESALAAINTVHNEVSSDLSVAQTLADQRIEESKRAVEIQTMNAEAEVEPLRWLAEHGWATRRIPVPKHRPARLAARQCAKRRRALPEQYASAKSP